MTAPSIKGIITSTIPCAAFHDRLWNVRQTHDIELVVHTGVKSRHLYRHRALWRQILKCWICQIIFLRNVSKLHSSPTCRLALHPHIKRNGPSKMRLQSLHDRWHKRNSGYLSDKSGNQPRAGNPVNLGRSRVIHFIVSSHRKVFRNQPRWLNRRAIDFITLRFKRNSAIAAIRLIKADIHRMRR